MIGPEVEASLRADFERLARDSYKFKRSRAGNYVNPAVSRDWKWFQLGYIAARHMENKNESSERDNGTTTRTIAQDR